MFLRVFLFISGFSFLFSLLATDVGMLSKSKTCRSNLFIFFLDLRFIYLSLSLVCGSVLYLDVMQYDLLV